MPGLRDAVRALPSSPSAVGRLKSALGLRPRRALSSAGAKNGFSVSVSLGVYGAGNGKRQFELINMGVTNGLAFRGELGQGGADVGGCAWHRLFAVAGPGPVPELGPAPGGPVGWVNLPSRDGAIYPCAIGPRLTEIQSGRVG